MKKIATIALSIILLAACRKADVVLPGNGGQADLVSKTNTQNVAVARPMKIELQSSADPTSPPLSCTLPGIPFGITNSGYFLSGAGTHVGNINSTTSMGIDDFCNLNGSLMLSTHTSGQIVAADGEKFTYEGNDQINLFDVVVNGATTAPITGLWNITGGTGRFAGASGSLTINGIVDLTTAGGPSLKISGNGTITY